MSVNTDRHGYYNGRVSLDRRIYHFQENDALKLRMFGATDKGLVRALNQDAYTCNASQGLVILSDGMGGHAAGEVASHMIVEGLSGALSAFEKYSVEEMPSRLDEAIQKVNTKVIMKSQEDPSCRGMGATVNVLCFSHGFVTIGHVGDSRTYLVRAFRTAENKPRFGIWSLTIDHNLGTFIDRGIMTPSEPIAEMPLTPRERSKLTRGMGVMTDPKPDIYSRRLEVGDVFLTCTDGLHGFVSDRDILKTIVTGSLTDAPQRLVDLAKAAGAPDNVTLVLTVISDESEPFRDFAGPTFQTRPYLLRLPNGEIQGLMTCQEIVDLWLQNSLPSNTEVAAGLGPWMLIRNKDQLFKTYPEFKIDKFHKHNHKDKNFSTLYKTLPETQSMPAKENDQPNHFKIQKHLKSVLIAAILSFFFVCLVWLIAAPEIAKILLPAY
jgi:serine/threonine protein phosphatase PrpC